MMLKNASTLALAALLAGCSSGPPRIPVKVLDRALASAGTTGLAQPGQIVATESAFARAARETGELAAFRAYAAPGAVWHGPKGLVDAPVWLASRARPEAALRWAPRDVWMSCDSTTAVSQGRFRDGAGSVGSYVTAWRKQADGQYRWTYHTSALDNPQPPIARPDQGEPDEIVVLAMELIKGHVADCKGKPADPGPDTNPVPQVKATAPDGSLHWLAQQRGDGMIRFIVLTNTAGEWQEMLDTGFDPG
jgi:hypothetical protein